MNLVNLDVVENSNGVRTYCVLFDNGNIYSRLDGDDKWTEQKGFDVSGHRNNNGSSKNTSSSNKKVSRKT